MADVIRWRVARSEWNLQAEPWRDAVMIEEDDDQMPVPGLVCAIYRGHGDEVPTLIAAAPELLEALKGVLRVADRATAEFDAAHAAVAKAEGRR